MTKKEAAKKRRKRRKTRPSDEYVDYLFEITDWDWSFSLSIAEQKDRWEPYHDLRHLNLRAKLLKPEKIMCDDAEIALMPNSELNEDKRGQNPRLSVGSLHRNRGQVTALLPIPSDALVPVLQMVMAGKFRYAMMGGERLRYGTAMLRSYRFAMKMDEEE